MFFFKKILKNNYLRIFRNFFLIKPTFSNYPKNAYSTISDYFYWREEKEFSTKFMLTNLSSQIFPDKNEQDIIKIKIYSNNGFFIKEINIILDPFETKEVEFKSLDIKGFGSFFVFHYFTSLNFIIKSQSFLAERGYVGYKANLGVWNFMHGNKFASYMDKRKNIKSIEATTLRYISYLPQVSFQDCKNSSIILNNPSNKKINYKLSFLDETHQIIEEKFMTIPNFGTVVSKIVNQTAYLKLQSKLMLSRPIILKNYNTYFDIFHG
jgi:hypothetical protein